MKYQRDLQVRLQERYRRLYKTGLRLYKNEASFLVSFIRTTPALRYLVDAVERSEPDLDPAMWARDNFGFGRADWPSSEEGRAKVAWHLLQSWAEVERGAAMFGYSLDPSDNNMDSSSRRATEAVVEPFIEFLQERIGEASDVLYLLERYVRRVEWFEQTHLWEAHQGDTRHGEDVYDRDLRQFLFEQGVDYPFSQPRSASGLSDVIVDLESDDPLVCEVKLYDGASYSKAYLAKGVQQAVSYACDYGKTVTYLVIINLSPKMLQLPSDSGPKEWPPRIEVGGVTVFLVHVRGLPQGSASTRGAADVVTITRDDLLRRTDDPGAASSVVS